MTRIPMATIAGKKTKNKKKKIKLSLRRKKKKSKKYSHRESESSSPESESKENSSQRQSHRVHPHAQPGPGTRASASVGQKFLERRDDLLITALVEFDEKNSRIPVLFSTAGKWEDFYKKIFGALNNKCSSFSMTYSCKNTQVSLNKDTWAVFIHFLKTQCEDQTVFINLACSSASVNNKLRYGLVQSSYRPTSNAEKSRDPSGSTQIILEKVENDINWDEKSIAKLPRTDRESLVRQLVTKLISEVNCKTCKKHHKQCVVNTKEIDELLEKKMRLACSSAEMRNFFDKKNMFQHVFRNSSLLLNPPYAQCPLCGTVVSLGHFNDILIKKDHLINHIELTHLKPLNSALKGKYVLEIRLLASKFQADLMETGFRM